MQWLFEGNRLLFIQAANTWFLVGLIWMVQVVHYPLFANVGEPGYTTYQQLHEQKITWIVGPTMVLELLIAILLVFGASASNSVDARLAWVSFVLVLLIWATTAFVSVPCHAKLSSGFDQQAHYWLVTTNWVRTIAWSIKGVLAMWMLQGAQSMTRFS